MDRPLKNATLRQLATFHALSRLGSITRTAQEMSLTQPAVSLQVSALEESAGVPLLARSARGVRLTEAGLVLAEYAARILALRREAGEAMVAQQGLLAGTLNIGAVTTAEHVLPMLLLAFHRTHPRVRVSLSVGNRAEVVDRLATGVIDLAIMGRPPPGLDADAAVFASHPLAFVAAPDHPLMRRAHVSLEDIRGANLLVRERGSGTRSALEQLFKAADVDFAFGSEMSSNEALKRMCCGGFGVAFLSLHACAPELRAGALRPLAMPGYPVLRDWQVIRLAGRPVPAAATVFEAFVLAHGRACIEGLSAVAQPAARESSAAAGG